MRLAVGARAAVNVSNATARPQSVLTAEPGVGGVVVRFSPASGNPYNTAGPGWGMFGGAFVYGVTGAGTTFVAVEDLGAMGRLFDACASNPHFGLEQLFAPVTSAPASVGYVPPVPVRPTAVGLEAGTIISDTYLYELPTGAAAGAGAEAELFVAMLSSVLLLLEPASSTAVTDWDAIAAQSARILATNPGALTQVDGNRYLRAYVNDPRGEPVGSTAAGYSAELVTQLETLEPLLRWEQARNRTTPLSALLLQSLPSDVFFHPEIGTVVDRPDRTRLTFNESTAAMCRALAGASEDELRYCADSWYIYYPLVKLADIATAPGPAARLPWAESVLRRSIDFAIRFARSQSYTFPILSSYVDPFVPPPCGGLDGCGKEFDVAYSYAYLMLRMYQLDPGNATFLDEAVAAFPFMHQGGMADRPISQKAPWRANDYEACNGVLGLVAQAELHARTGDAKYLDGVHRTLSFWLPYVTTFQVTWGRAKGFMPTFMAVDAMIGAYPAPFENHNSARYLAQFLELCADKLDPVVARFLRMLIKYASGVTRYCYPDRLPAGLLSPTAAGAGTVHHMPTFPNNASINIPVEDL